MRKENFHEVSKCSNNVSNKYGHYGHQKIQLEPKTLGMPYCATGSSLTAVSHFRKSLKVVRGSFGPPSEYSSSLDLQRKSRELIVQQTARNKIRFQINQTNKNVVGASQIWIPPGHAFFPRQDYSENRSETPLSLESTHAVPKSIPWLRLNCHKVRGSMSTMQFPYMILWTIWNV